MRRHRVVMIAPRVGDGSPAPSAGLGHLQNLQIQVDGCADLLVLTPPDAPPAGEGAVATGFEVRVPGPRWMRTLLGRGENLLRRLDLTLPPLPLALGLLLDPRARAALAGVDVVDLQWEEYAALAPIVRRIAPHARRIGSFHDVLSHLAERRLARAPGVIAARRVQVTRRHERRILRHLDLAVALSPADAALLRAAGAADVTVLDPLIPLASGGEHVPDPPGRPTVGIVAAFGREVNQAGTRWFVEHVWPRVLHGTDGARLLLVGADPTGFATAVAAGDPSIEATGFIEDLDAAYADLTVVAVPLLLGSGIKFKTLEALARGLPAVSTPIGAEGIEAARHLVAITTDPEAFADSLIEVLQDPAPFHRDAARIAPEIRRQYGPEAFSQQVRRLYAAPTETS